MLIIFLMNTSFKILLFSFILNFSMIAMQQTNNSQTITIFVHGTSPMRKLLQYSPGRSLMYAHQGLNLAKDLPKNYHFHKIAQACVDANPQSYTLDQFYIFGWNSEKVYDSTRKQAAEVLVKKLQELISSYYDQYHIIPNIQLIGFSHGGNVILNTANYLPLSINNQKIKIEALIFGTPVQQVNCDLVNSQNFSKVYSFYSTSDWIQRIDAQGLYNKHLRKTHFWSDRMFDQNSQCIQVKFTVNNKPIGHIYYRYIFKYLPKIQALTKEKSHGLNCCTIDIDLSTKKVKT